MLEVVAAAAARGIAGAAREDATAAGAAEQSAAGTTATTAPHVHKYTPTTKQSTSKKEDKEEWQDFEAVKKSATDSRLQDRSNSSKAAQDTRQEFEEITRETGTVHIGPIRWVETAHLGKPQVMYI